MHTTPPSGSQNVVTTPPAAKAYHCGTLTYTKMGLFVLFAWLLWWMYSKQQMFAFKWYGLAVVPLCLSGVLLWSLVKQKLRRDIVAAKDGAPLRNGIPHHGMLIVLGSKFLLAFGIWVCQVLVAATLNMEGGAIVFGVANALTNFLLIGTVYLMCRIERGFSVTVNESYTPFENASV
jgi:hypothetical protein